MVLTNVNNMRLQITADENSSDLIIDIFNATIDPSDPNAKIGTFQINRNRSVEVLRTLLVIAQEVIGDFSEYDDFKTVDLHLDRISENYSEGTLNIVEQP